MKKTVLLFILFIITFSISSCDSDKCGCVSPPFDSEFYKSWRLSYTDVNGKQVPSDKKEILTLYSTGTATVKAFYKNEIDDEVIENTAANINKANDSSQNAIIVTITLNNVIYKQKLKQIYVSGQPPMLVATTKVKENENFGDYILHYDLYLK